MGFLSGLLSVGGAVLGGVVGGPAGASLGASIGGEIGGGLAQSSASSSASKAQIAAQQAAQAARDKAFGQVQDAQAPYLAEGQPALNALNSRLGLSVPPPQTSSAVAPPIPPSPSPTATNALTGATAAAPSLAAAPTSGNALATTPIPLNTAPTSTGAAPPPGTAQTGASQAPAAPGAPGAPGVDPGTFGSTANPTEPGTYTPPADFSYGAADYTASPAYAYQQDQAQKAILASSAATGALQSGAALKALQDRAENIAYGDFSQERAAAQGIYDDNRNAGVTTYNLQRGAYDDDRNYLTNRFDTQTDNLFRTAGIGQGAAGVVSNAAVNNGNGAASSALGIGNAQAGSALQQGNIASGVIGNVSGQVANALTGMKTASQTDPVSTKMPTAASMYSF